MRHRQKQIRNWIIFFVILFGIIGGLIYLGRPVSDAELFGQVTQIRETDHQKGNPDAPVVIVEYSDFECSFCASHAPIMQQLVNDLGDQFVFVYRHFPLRGNHPNAQISAQAAEAAALQGQFWPMHDLLFEQQAAWSAIADPAEVFVGYAQELGLDPDQFRSDLTSTSTRNRVNDDYTDAIRLGLQSTPTFFINGEKLERPLQYAGFKARIEAAAVPQE